MLVLLDGAGNEYVLELDNNYRVESVTTENTESLLHRYITGSEDDRREIARTMLGGDLENQEDDTNYTDYVYKYYTGKNWDDVRNYDLCINSASYGIEGSVQLIERIIKKHTGRGQ